LHFKANAAFDVAGLSIRLTNVRGSRIDEKRKIAFFRSL
jgi:hypothetical protein